MDKIRQFGNQMQYRMAQFMYGRNGFDTLARTCNGIKKEYHNLYISETDLSIGKEE